MKWSDEWYASTMPCVVIRRFGFGAREARAMTTVYQPLLGHVATALYVSLCHWGHDHTDAVTVEMNVALVMCGFEPSERGFKQWAHHSSFLEAAGLLTSYYRADPNGAQWTFVLHTPLLVNAFFADDSLTALLQERVGPMMYQALYDLLFPADIPRDDATYGTDVSHTKKEVYHASHGTNSHVASGGQQTTGFYRPEDVLRRFPRSSKNRRFVERMLVSPTLTERINAFAVRYDLTLKETVSLLDEEGMFRQGGEFEVTRFAQRAAQLRGVTVREDPVDARAPSPSHNPEVVSLGASSAGNAIPIPHRTTTTSLVTLPVVTRQSATFVSSVTSFSAPSSESSVASVVSLEPALREEREQDIWTKLHGREVDALHWFELPDQFQHTCDVRQYNAMLVNASYGEILRLFFHPSSVPAAIKEAFHEIHVAYHLPDEVLNAMIHYIRTNDFDWSTKFIDAIAANIAGKHIRQFEQAVAHFRKAERTRQYRGKSPSPKREEGTRTKSDAGYKSRPPRVPSPKVVPPSGNATRKEATPEDIARIMEKARRMHER